MVTGDHPLTAEAIARQINIITEDSVASRILTDDDKLERNDNKKGDRKVEDSEKFVLIIIYSTADGKNKLTKIRL